MSAQPSGTFQVRLLDGLARVFGSDEGGLKYRCDELLAGLVLSRAPVPAAQLRQLLRMSDDALHQCVHRLKAYGLEIANDRSHGYRLVIGDGAVDALAFLRVAAVPPTERGENDTDEALSWWGAGPDEALSKQYPTLFEELFAAHKLLLGQRKKRILIVDDKVGHHLARLLRRNCRSEVVTDLDGFDKWESSLASFDLALVDIHLTDSYVDHQGLQIVDRIVNSATDVLVVGMTKAPVPGATREWQRKHDLAELILKSGDDETSDFSAVVAHVRALLDAGPAAHARRLMEDFGRVVEEAVTRLKALGDQHQVELLRKNVLRIHERQLDGAPLSELRGMIRAFRSQWRVEYPLG